MLTNWGRGTFEFLKSVCLPCSYYQLIHLLDEALFILSFSNLIYLPATATKCNKARTWNCTLAILKENSERCNPAEGTNCEGVHSAKFV
jgi:hypothetical protein